jgi:protein-S-isoprenylcysteine O-methyltransferase Ste14
MIRQGHHLFRWRSYLPLAILPIIVVVFFQSGWVNDMLGAGMEEGWDYACLALALIGLSVRAATVGFVPAGTSGRNTASQKAAVLNTTGAYSLVRHPLYFANFIIFIAFVMGLKSLLFTLLATVLYFVYYERIMLAEEAFLESKYRQRYRDWAERTPLFIPRLSGWIKPALPFSWRTALMREIHGLLLIAVVFFAAEALEATVLEHRSLVSWMGEEPVWIVVLAVAVALYLPVVVIKKRTAWLRVAGR